MNVKYMSIFLSLLFIVSCDSKQKDNVEIVGDSLSSGVQVSELNVKEQPEKKQPEKKVEKAGLSEPLKVVKSTPPEKAMTGEQVYNNTCQNCHATGAAGSPKLDDVANWKPRIAKGKDALYLSAIQGVPSTAMMAKGTCSQCSEKELRAAVDYMLTKINGN